jgi:hypothetical protein
MAPFVCPHKMIGVSKVTHIWHSLSLFFKVVYFKIDHFSWKKLNYMSKNTLQNQQSSHNFLNKFFSYSRYTDRTSREQSFY